MMPPLEPAAPNAAAIPEETMHRGTLLKTTAAVALAAPAP
jgi:hypothetical protein